MAISAYLRDLRTRVGTRLLLVPSAAAIVRDAGGRILVQRRSDNGAWSLPAGAVGPGEAPAQAAVREVWEETGLVVTPTALLGVYGGEGFRTRYPNGDEVEYTVAVFACRPVDGRTPRPNDDESTAVAWAPPDAMPPLGLPYPPELFTHQGAAAMFDWRPEWQIGPERPV